MKKLNINAYRVFRGGSWYNSASNLRAASRFNGSPSSQFNFIGARLVRSKR